MRIKFHGAIGTVIGSCYELYEPSSNVRFLVDCGMQQGESGARQWYRQEFPFDPASLDFVVLTHGHVDHCGLIPLLYTQGFTGEVYCTQETTEVATKVLRNSAKYSNLYDGADVERIRWREHGEGPLFEKWFQAAGDIYFRYFRSGHILGATSVEFWWGAPGDNNRILFSGDLGNNTQGAEFQPLMRHRMKPDTRDTANDRYVVMESTCGGHDMSAAHRSFEKRQQRLLEVIQHTVRQKRGTLLMPCFAVQRTQDVLFDLHYLFATHPELSDIPVYFDAKMADEINRSYATGLGRQKENIDGDNVPAWLNERLFEWMGLGSATPENRQLLVDLLQEMLVEEVTLSKRRKKHRSPVVQQWKKIWRSVDTGYEMPEEVGGPCVVVTGGGMCSGGPVVSYLQKLARQAMHTVLLTGYCGASTNGGKLRNLAGKSRAQRRSCDDALDIGGEHSIPCADVRADIEHIGGYSGHADRKELIDWLFPDGEAGATPLGATVFLTHGTDNARMSLRDNIVGYARRLNRQGAEIPGGFEVELPTTKHGWFDLDCGRWCSSNQERSDESIENAVTSAAQYVV